MDVCQSTLSRLRTAMAYGEKDHPNRPPNIRSVFTHSHLILNVKLSGRILHIIPWRLIQAHADVVLLIQVLTQDLPDHVADIFGSRIEVFEFLRIQVQVFMVKAPLDLLFDDVLEHLQIDQVARHGVYFSADLDLQLIIVAVVIGVIAQPEDLLILLIAPVGIVQPVGGIEVGATENSYSHA